MSAEDVAGGPLIEGQVGWCIGSDGKPCRVMGSSSTPSKPGEGGGGSPKWSCYYCNHPTADGPYVDELGVGHLATCMDEECIDKDRRDTFRQREAMKAHDEGRQP